ncbi:hypothetical protein [Streptomyces parvulus]|uniref:hypothetical protein n=1 Tax=Streptomyces parvulus TaxID=146923 RepID=UPI00339F36F4
MSAPTIDDILALGIVPRPGDHAAVDKVCDSIGRTAVALGEIKKVLDGAANGYWRGKAAIVFRKLLDDEFRPKVVDAYDSFDEADKADKAKEAAAPKDKDIPQGSPSGTSPLDDPLEPYRRTLDTLTGNRTTRAGHYAGKIRDEIDDVIEDSWWDDVKGWVHDHANGIKAFIDVLGWVATVAGFLALAIPGLNLLVLGIAALTIGLRLLLVASGDASWTDVIFDVVGGLLVVGGLGAAAKLASGAKATVGAAQGARTAGLRQGLRGVKGVLDDTGRLMNKLPEGPGRQALGAARNAMRKSISQNVGLVAKGPLRVSPLSTLVHLGDKEMAGMAKMLQANKAAFPAAAGAAADKAYKSYQAGLGVAWTGMGMDVMDKTLGKSDLTSWTKEEFGSGEKPYNAAYSDWKDNTLKPAADTHW